MTDSHITTRDGIRLFVRTFGEPTGHSALLVPNGIAYADDLLVPLSRDRQVIAFDLRNRGYSDASATARGLPDDVADLEHVRATLGLDRVVTLGHSYVSVPVIRHAMVHADHVASVVMIGAPPPVAGTTYPPDLAYADEVTARVMSTLPQLYQAGLSPDELFTRAWDTLRPLYVADPRNAAQIRWERGDCPNERAFMPYFMGVVQPSLAALQLTPADYAAARMPVLVVHGTKDRGAPIGGAHDWADRLPNAELFEVPNTGHAPWLEDVTVIPRIRAFLGQGTT